MKKKYTHAKGFNITSLKEVAGLYFFHNIKGEIEYIGMCNKDFKNRINSHAYGSYGKLSSETVYLRVVIANHIPYQLHVLEHLFIWYFNPKKNKTYCLFSYADNEKQLKRIAKLHGIHIRGSLEKLILSFMTVLIKRECDEKFIYKRYGDEELLSTKIEPCNETLNCLCYRCLVIGRTRY